MKPSAWALLLVAGCATPTIGDGLTVRQRGAADAVIAADRAFDQRAGSVGQWTAFRETATADALMFLPKPTLVRDFLKDRPDPKGSVRWWPRAVTASCDGTLVASRGGANWPGGQFSEYLTLWQPHGDGTWKWTADAGAMVAAAPPPVATVGVDGARCRNLAAMPQLPKVRYGGGSADRTLRWHLDEARGRIVVEAWDGSGYRTVHDGPVE